MTPEQIRIKIAEACGWTIWRAGIEPCKAKPDGSAPIWRLGDDVACAENLPDPYDLNECHKMEKVLTEDQREIYAQILTGMSLCDREGRMDWGGVFDEVAHVTATQRCEAFLKTLGLFES